MAYEAVIFDNDGVLTRPTPIETRRAAVEAAFRSAGAAPCPEAVDSVVHGDREAVTAACDRYGVDPESFWARHESCSASTQRTAMLDGRKPLYDDVRSTVEALDRPIGIVSNNQHETIRHLLDVFGLEGRVSVALGREPTLDGFARCKPDPTYLQRALDRIGTRDVLFVGDSNADLLAADRAGVDSAFVRREHRVGYDLATDPTYELDALDDLAALA
ncbi:HAD family hydrolase [Halobaculum sp. EA56]|uniref:HAD family hydrolase n=1 Tax=Halobaculum sp. EA56 TaxID=3421648 RepID=UPI003EBF30A7